MVYDGRTYSSSLTRQSASTGDQGTRRLAQVGNAHDQYQGEMATSAPVRVDTDVALLIDWENLKLSLRDHFGVSPNIDSLLDAANASGRVVLARAYADWTRSLSSVDAPNLYRAGIEPIYVPGREADGRALKNSADVRMAVDAVDVCVRLPHVQTFVLVTGDGDLIHAVNFLQVGGKQVVVIGVRRSISDLLASTCDRLMFYERDVEPLIEEMTTDEPIELTPGDSAAMEIAFQWAKTIIGEPNDDRPYPFKRLRNELRLRHGFDSRARFGLSFRHFMLRAERAGLVHLSTIGGLDYASLARSAPRLDETSLESVTPFAATASGAPEIRLESLTDEEQRSVIGFLKRLQDRSPYMVRKYIVDNLEYGSVLPRLSRDQLDRLVLTLIEQQILVERRVSVTHPSTGDALRAETLSLNEKLPFVQERLSRADPFALLPAAVREARQLKGIGYFPLVQSVLERRLGGRLSEAGYQRLTAFFEEAEQRGIVRIAHLPNGADILLLPDDEMPATTTPAPSGSVMDEIGPEGVATVLRIVAAAEDRIGGRPVYLGSLIFAVRSMLTVVEGPDLGSSQLNRLLKDELRQAGYMRPVPLSLNRDHPTVQEAMSEGPLALPANINVQPYGNTGPATPTSATTPAPTGATTSTPSVQSAPSSPSDPPWPTPEELASDLAAGNRDLLYESLIALLKARAPDEYRFTDLGNDLRKHFRFQLKEHPQIATKFGDLITQLGQHYPIEIRKQNAHYFVRYTPSAEVVTAEPIDEVVEEPTPIIGDVPTPEPVETEAVPSHDSAVLTPEAPEQPVKTRQRRPRRRTTAPAEQPPVDVTSEPEPVVEAIQETTQPDVRPVEATTDEGDGTSEEAEPTSPPPVESSADEADLTGIPDPVIAAALREIIAFENDHPGAATDPATWRRRFRQAVERAGGPRLDAKSMSQLIRARLLPHRLIEPAGPADSGRKLRPYQIRRNHPNVVALVGRREATSANGTESEH